MDRNESKGCTLHLLTRVAPKAVIVSGNDGRSVAGAVYFRFVERRGGVDPVAFGAIRELVHRVRHDLVRGHIHWIDVGGQILQLVDG